MAFRFIGVTSTIEMGAADNPVRRSLGFFNNGSVDVYVSTNRVNVSTEGWVIAPGAGVVFLAIDGDDVDLAHFLAADSGTQNVRIQEGFRDPDSFLGIADIR